MKLTFQLVSAIIPAFEFQNMMYKMFRELPDPEAARIAAVGNYPVILEGGHRADIVVSFSRPGEEEDYEIYSRASDHHPFYPIPFGGYDRFVDEIIEFGAVKSYGLKKG